MKLGKKPGVVKDPRTIQLRKLTVKKHDTPPKSSFVGRAEEVRMYGNDKYGDCVFATKGHRIDLQERSSHQKETQVSTSDILTAYSAVTGFNPDYPDTDNGAYLLDGMNYERTVGIGMQNDGTRHRIGAFAALKMPLSIEEFTFAHWALGGVQVGAWLPLSALQQMQLGKPWTVVSGPEGEPGTWGGHAMYSAGYDAKYLYLATWDIRQKVTWDWARKYIDEAYVSFSEDFLLKSGKTRQGLDIDRLNAILADIGV